MYVNTYIGQCRGSPLKSSAGRAEISCSCMPTNTKCAIWILQWWANKELTLQYGYFSVTVTSHHSLSKVFVHIIWKRYLAKSPVDQNSLITSHWRELDVSRCCWPKFVTSTILVFTIKSIVAIFFFYYILPTKRWKNVVYPRKSFANLLRGKQMKVKNFRVTVPSHRYSSIISIVFV